MLPAWCVSIVSSVGRPTKRTPEREAIILDALAAGNTRRAAAAAAGVDERTVERWQARSVGFADALRAREAQSEVRLVAMIARAAETDWRAAAHLLACRFPESWSQRARVDVQIIRHQAERIAADLGLSADELIAEAERIVAGN